MAAAPRYFGVLPRAGVRRPRRSRSTRRRTPRSPTTTRRRPTGRGPGIYYANGYDLPSRKYTKLATTTYHEAAPGPPLPDRPRDGEPEPQHASAGSARGWSAGAYVEGWGLYSERLADEMGLYRDEASASGCSTRRPGARRGSSSTPASTPCAGRASARSTSCSRRAVRDRRGHRDRPLHLLARPGPDLQDRPARDRAAARELAARDGSHSTCGRSTTPCWARLAAAGDARRELPNWLATPADGPGATRHRRNDMPLIQEIGYSVKLGMEEAHQRWLEKERERLAAAHPAGMRYIGTTVVVFSTDKKRAPIDRSSSSIRTAPSTRWRRRRRTRRASSASSCANGRRSVTSTGAPRGARACTGRSSTRRSGSAGRARSRSRSRARRGSAAGGPGDPRGRPGRVRAGPFDVATEGSAGRGPAGCRRSAASRSSSGRSSSRGPRRRPSGSRRRPARYSRARTSPGRPSSARTSP